MSVEKDAFDELMEMKVLPAESCACRGDLSANWGLVVCFC